ncbi:hypothetical protein [Burkholderia sp. LMU1-1-1.1]|uniref:hypothetical protein n=1 Tax=Burkholderia sp. LMU1-1-1.1 TaxID=3135266 RepID=UPI0034471CEE
MMSQPSPVRLPSQRWLQSLLCVNLLLLLFYLLVDYQLVYHSDSAVKNLLAQEILDGGQYFPADWNYVNRDLWVFNLQTFLLPLLPWVANGYQAGVFSNVASAALILHGSWLLTGLLEQSRPTRLVGMLVISAGMSLVMAEHVYGQAAYGSMYYMACYLLYAYWSLSQAPGARTLPWGAALALLTTLLFWANPQRALLVYGLPLLAAGAVQYALAARAQSRRPSPRHLWALALVVAAIVAGVLLHGHVLSQRADNAGLTALHWLDFDGMLKNVAAVVHGTMLLFDGLPGLESPVASLSGAYAALRLVTALALLWLLPWGLWRALRATSGPRQLVVVFAAVSFGAHLLVITTTTVADMSDPGASVRYLVPSLMFLLLILVGVVLERRALAPLARAAGLGAVVVLATSAPVAYLYPYNQSTALEFRGLMLMTPALRLADFLRQHGLRYGYATFWEAGKTTVLSDSAVRVRQVELAQGLPQPSRHLSSNRWYAPAAWRGPTFLMLRDSELALLDLPALASYAGQPRHLRFEDMNIFVFPANLAASLPAWDQEIRQPLRYRMTARTPHQIGHIGDGAIEAGPGESGALHFGPMRALTPGTYDISFDLDAGGDGTDFGMVDVIAQGAQVLARRPITTPGRQRVTLRVHTERPLVGVEFRAFSSGSGHFKLNGIELARPRPGLARGAPAATATQEK